MNPEDIYRWDRSIFLLENLLPLAPSVCASSLAINIFQIHSDGRKRKFYGANKKTVKIFSKRLAYSLSLEKMLGRFF